MILQKDFLQKALPLAQFFINGKNVTADTVWMCKGLDINVGAAIDSRMIVQDDVFFALEGVQTDGHNFIVQALEKGACALVIKEGKQNCLDGAGVQQKLVDTLIIVVTDPCQALVAITRAWRALFSCPVVGITGSIGKTTTKEMVRSLLESAQIPAHVSYKNYNTELGVCLNLLRADRAVKAIVLEVGINHKDEMARIASILQPTIGLITCVAHSHGEGLGGLQEIAYEKRQLFSQFKAHDVGIVFGDQELLSDVHYHHPIAKFGFKTKNQVQARKVKVIGEDSGELMTHFTLKWYGQRADICLKGNHAGLAHNALSASAIAYFLQIPFEAVVKGLEGFKGFENRFETRKLKDGKGLLLSDCYNANPESMRAALLAFEQMPATGKKVVVLGDMLELGERELYWHRQIGRVLFKTLSVTSLILVGERAKVIAKTAPITMHIDTVNDWQEACVKLDHMLSADQALVLVKASGGMKLDKMVAQVTEAA